MRGAVLETWQRDYNERSHSKLGRMTPKGFPRAICAPAGDRAASPVAPARTPLANHLNSGPINPGLLSRQSPAKLDQDSRSGLQSALGW